MKKSHAESFATSLRANSIDRADITPTAPGPRADAFDSLLEKVMRRRAVLKSGIGMAALPFLSGLVGCGSGGESNAAAVAGVSQSATGPAISFKAVPVSSGDTVVVPDGYTAQALYRWGDPLSLAAPEFAGDVSQGWAAQELQAGDNHDGMHFFPFVATDGNPRSDGGLLVMNHEYINPEYFYAPGANPADWLDPFTFDMARKAQAAHGVSVVEVRRKTDGTWEYVRNSLYNRRITGYSPIALTGPAAGDAQLRTAADPGGTEALGTLNNCANGYTPWGTYLTCEENFNGYFGWNGAHTASALEARYGVSQAGSGYRWHTVDPRFDVNATPNEPNRFGWVVEVDPFAPASKPKKRTALGRFKHENAELVLAEDGRVVVYMGDDERGEYLYKFVSQGRFDPKVPGSGRDLLDAGTLYVARLGVGAVTNDQAGTGEWLPLVFGQNGLDTAGGFASQADVLIRARQAADVVGATRLDRPEWVAANSRKRGEVYLTLTNNSNRGVSANQPVDEANPRARNFWGHILRWNEADANPAALTFVWDIFLLGGNPKKYPDRTDLRSGSAAINEGNMFNSPDGLAFDTDGRLWIQSDGNYSNTGEYEGQGNNQMLVANTITGEVKRFLTGPSGCEITGVSWTPDLRAMFINIQHPGELTGHPNAPRKPDGSAYVENDIARDPTRFSKWPDGAAATRPRAATVVIRKNDGGVIGT